MIRWLNRRRRARAYARVLAIRVHPSTWDRYYCIPPRCLACVFPERDYAHDEGCAGR